MGVPVQFIESIDSIIETPPNPAYATRQRFVAPSKMRPGDMLVVLLVSDADKAIADLGGTMTIESRMPGTGGAGTQCTIASTGGAAFLELDGPSGVRVRYNAATTTYEDVEALFNQSWYVRVRQRFASGLLPHGEQVTTSLASSGLPQSWISNVAWAFDENFAAGVGGLRMFRRVVTDAEPAAYTFDSTIANKAAAGVLLVYRGLAAAAMVAGSASTFTAATFKATPAIATSRVSDLLIGGVWQLNNWGDDPTAAVSTASTYPGDGAIERSDRAVAIAGVYARRLQVFDFPPNRVDTVSKQVGFGASQTGIGFAIVLAGEVIKGIDLGWTPIVMGAIGLPLKGI